MYRKLLFFTIVIVGIFFAIAVFAQTCDPDFPGCATCPQHIYEGINCGSNWYCNGCKTGSEGCFDCPRAGDPTGATILNYVSCTCQCPSGKIVCSGACVTAPTCPTPTREQNNSSCNGCGACKAGYSPDPLNPDPPSPCLKTAFMDYANTGFFQASGDLKSTGGNLYLASGKAIRIDAAGNATLNIGNWGGGSRFDLNLYGGGGGLNLQNGFLTGAYIAQSPWATNVLGSKNAFGLQVNRLLGATTGRYTVTTSGFSGGSDQVMFDGFYDASKIIPYGGTGVVEIDFNPQVGWTPNTTSGFVYMDGTLVINFYYTFLPTNVKVEMYRYSGGADGWQTIFETTTNNKNPLIIPTNPIFNYVKKLKITFSGGGDPTYGIRVAEIEWFPTRELSADQLVSVPKYYPQNVDISIPELRMRSSLNWSNITAKITNSGDVVGTRLCIGADCRSSWPEAVNAFVDEGNVGFGPIAMLGTNDDVPLAFEVNNSEKMRINTAGNVGIGTTNAPYKLMVAGSAPRIYLQPSAGTNSELDFGSHDLGTHWAIYRDTASDQLRFWRNDNRVVITSDGNVGIGTTSPAYKIDVAGQINANTGLSPAVQGISSAAAGYGGYFEASGASGYGIYSVASNPAGGNYGGYFQADGDNSAAIFSYAPGNESTGIFAYTTGQGSTAVAGVTTGTTNTNYGGQFSGGGGGIMTDGQNNFGVWGAAKSAPNRNFGGLFTVGDTWVDVRVPGPVSIGVAGIAANTAGTEYAGYFRVDSASGYGVYGKSNEASSWAGYFTGGKGVYTPQLCLGTEGNCRTDWPTSLTSGTIADSTLRWNGTNWVENTSFRVNSGGGVTAGAWLGSPISVAYGGTGLTSTPNSGELLIGNGTGYTLANLTGAANRIIVTNGPGSITLSTPQDIATTSSPTFASLTLSNPLPVLSGGTGSIGFNAGSVIFSDGTKLTQDNANFFWNNTNKRLGIGTNAPAYSLDVAGDVNFTGDLRIGTGSSTNEDFIYFDDGTKWMKWEESMGRFKFGSAIFSDSNVSGLTVNSYNGGDIFAADPTNQKNIRIQHDGTNGIVETNSADPGIDYGNLVLQSNYAGRYVIVQDDLGVQGGATVGAVSNMGFGTLNAQQLCIAGTCKSSWPSGTIDGSGTTNYLAKFTGASTIGNSQIYDNGTNLGIGTTTPSQKLHVVGNTYISGNLGIGWEPIYKLDVNGNSYLGGYTMVTGDLSANSDIMANNNTPSSCVWTATTTTSPYDNICPLGKFLAGVSLTSTTGGVDQIYCCEL